MGRSVKSLDPKVREKVEQLLAEGKLSGNKIAKKCRIDFANEGTLALTDITFTTGGTATPPEVD